MPIPVNLINADRETKEETLFSVNYSTNHFFKSCLDNESVFVLILEIDGLEEEPNSPLGEEGYVADSNLR